jgi:hypothetical protein
MRAIVVVCLLAVLSLISKTAHADDWNFTPTDYQNLTNGGGDLSFASDADWLPQELKDNLMKTLKHVLRKDTTNTEGVNTKDFYHGHVVCPKPCKEEQNKPRQAYEKAAKDYEDKHPKTDEETVKAWKASLVKEEEKLLGDLLKLCVKTGCGVVYHTYETSKPKGMDADDPRRNIFTPTGNGKEDTPHEFKPTPAPGSTRDAYDDFAGKYCFLFEFAFLIDKRALST